MFNIPHIETMSPHRLDLQTSGVVVFARNANALKSLSEQFRERKTLKKYTAVVNGTLLAETGVFDQPIGRDTIAGPPFFTIDHTSEGKAANTEWRVVERGRFCTQVDLFPSTGRTHQLRLHLTAAGCPIVGDFFYSPLSVYRLSPRLLLHAEELTIEHPITGKRLLVSAPAKFSVKKIDKSIEAAHMRIVP